MNRLTWPLSPLRLNSSTTSFLTRSLSPPPSFLRCPAVLVPDKTLASKDSPRPHPVISSMNDPLRPDPTVAAAAAEDYVHIEDPNANAEILGESFVGVEDEPRENEDGAADVVTMAEGGGEDRGELDWTWETVPEELSRTVTVLSCESSVPGGIYDVYIIGTAHDSQDSCREAQAVISCLKPEVVFLELCASRVAVLSPQNLKVPRWVKWWNCGRRSIMHLELFTAGSSPSCPEAGGFTRVQISRRI